MCEFSVAVVAVAACCLPFRAFDRLLLFDTYSCPSFCEPLDQEYQQPLLFRPLIKTWWGPESFAEPMTEPGLFLSGLTSGGFGNVAEDSGGQFGPGESSVVSW